MRVVCHFVVPKPPNLKLDAAVQDGMKIIDEVGGEINFLYPGKEYKRWFPQFFCGIQQLLKLKMMEKRVDVHHIFSNGFYPYPIFAFLKKKIVLSTVTSLREDTPIKCRLLFRKIQHFIVPTVQDQRLMKKWGYNDVSVVEPGIDLARFTFSYPRVNEDFVLFAGSAPWNKKQFYSKGVDLLLEAMRKLPWLRVVFLWRGVHLEEMKARVSAAKVSSQVTVLTESVDVNDVLAEVHVGVVIAENRFVIKSYPHSLLETLAAGKPVLVSDCLPMSDFVSFRECGETLQGLSLENFIFAVSKLRTNYQNYVSMSRELDLSRFSEENMVKSIENIYNKL